MRSSASVGYLLRPFLATDLPATFALQQESYPESLRDAPQAFASRLDVGPETCWVAEREGQLHGYILAHPWPPASPPAVDTVIAPPGAPGSGSAGPSPVPAPGTPGSLVHYVHDLSVASAARGTGLGRGLLEHSLRAASRLGLKRSELVAVPGASGYWARLGYAPVPASGALAEKLRGYGAGAVYMRRVLGEDDGS